MVGWKRIVITVGERIGKEKMTYAQGASAGLVDMVTILPPTPGACRFPPRTFSVPGSRGTMAANEAAALVDCARHCSRVGLHAARPPLCSPAFSTCCSTPSSKQRLRIAEKRPAAAGRFSSGKPRAAANARKNGRFRNIQNGAE